MLTTPLLFSGLTQVVTVPANTLHDDLDPWTVACWLRVTSLSAGGSIIVKGRAVDNNRRIAFTYGGAGQVGISADRNTADMSYQTANSTLAAGNNYFLVGTFNSANAAGDLVRLYISTNGGPLTKATWTTATDGSGTFRSDATVALTLCNNSAGGGPAPLGYVWGIVLCKAELNQQECTELMENFNHPVRGLIGKWMLGANGTGRVLDMSGNNLHGTITGAIPASFCFPKTLSTGEISGLED